MRAKRRRVFLQSGNLICPSSAIALASRLSLISAGENIRAFQISGKSGRPFGTVFRTGSRTGSLQNSGSNLREYCDAH